MEVRGYQIVTVFCAARRCPKLRHAGWGAHLGGNKQIVEEGASSQILN
jgi:hypothetical protein